MLRMAMACAASAAAFLTLAPSVEAASTIRIASGLARPIYVTAPEGDARLFIVEQRGVIKIYKDGEILPEPFLDIDALVPDIGGNDERGLLGLAFAPDYATSGIFYVHHTNLSSDTEIARYQVSSDPDVADPGSRELILSVDQPFSNHNGGTITFGPNDGYLYIALGDGGSAGDPGNRAQTLSTLLGKILRIDVSGPGAYTIPPDNPFVSNPGARDEIWAWGVRNPYRISFDRETADLWIADVGQYDWEEVDFQPAASEGGENYGWRLMEGFHCFNPPTDCDDGDPVLTYPIHEYGHSQGCSITGGYVYRGMLVPELEGAYFFADYCSARIWSLRYDGETVTDLTERTSELAPGGGLSINSISSFGETGFGELLIVDRGTGSNGEIYLVVPDDASSAEEPGPAAATLRLLEASPNPFRSSVSVQLQGPSTDRVEVRVVDASGREVRRLFDGAWAAGTRALHWDGRDAAGREVPSGVYFVRAVSDAGASVGSRLVLIR